MALQVPQALGRLRRCDVQCQPVALAAVDQTSTVRLSGARLSPGMVRAASTTRDGPRSLFGPN